MSPRPPRGGRPRPPYGYKPRGQKTMDTIPEQKEVPSIRFTNFSSEQSERFLDVYMRLPIYTDMEMSLKIREENNKYTHDLLSSAALLSTPETPPTFPRSHASYIKTPFYPEEAYNIVHSLGVQYGLGGSQTNVMLKEVFVSHIIARQQSDELLVNNENSVRVMLTALTLELYILHNLRHENILNPLKVYTEPTLGRYQIAFAPHVPLRKVMDEIIKQFPDRNSFFDGAEIPQFIVHEVATALAFLLKHKLSHNRISANTIYVNSNGMVRLGDFERCTRYNFPGDYKDPNDPFCHRPSTEYLDIYNLGILYTKLTIPGYIDAMIPQGVFDNPSMLSAHIEGLVNFFDRKHKRNQRKLVCFERLPLKGNQIQFLLTCFNRNTSPNDLLYHPYLRKTPASRRDSLARVIRSLGIPLQSRVSTGHFIAPIEPPTKKSMFETNYPEVEFRLSLIEEGGLSFWNSKFWVPAYDTRYWMVALYDDVIDTYRRVQIYSKYNFQPSDVLTIHATMKKLVEKLDQAYCDFLIGESLVTEAKHIMVEDTIRMGHDSKRRLNIQARIYGITGVQVAETWPKSPPKWIKI
uniref:Protein kinase domain-containing protein n=1 Tax=Panagrellus redivivus TaxID=6233 RepID=A0A7E4V0Y2_PANRE